MTNHDAYNHRLSDEELDIIKGMVQGHHKSINEINKFIDMCPSVGDHHDDHLYITQSRERTKIMIHGFLENAGKLIFLVVVAGILAIFASKAGII